MIDYSAAVSKLASTMFLILTWSCGSGNDISSLMVSDLGNQASSQALTATPLPDCSPIILRHQQAHSETCSGAWRYAVYDCHEIQNSSHCGISGYETKTVSRANRCRLPQFGYENFFHEQDSQYAEFSGNSAMPRYHPPRPYILEDGRFISCFDPFSDKSHRRWMAQMNCANYAREQAARNLPPLYYGSCDVGKEIRWNYVTIENRLRGAQVFEIRSGWRFKVTFYGPVDKEREDPICGSYTVEEPDLERPVYSACRSPSHKIDQYNTCQSAESVFYDSEHYDRASLSEPHRPWWDEPSSGVRCTSCDHIPLSETSEKLDCLINEWHQVQSDSNYQSNQLRQAENYIVGLAKLIFEVSGFDLTERQKILVRLMYENLPNVNLCASTTSSPDEEPEDANCSAESTFCARLRQEHVSPFVRAQYTQQCAQEGT